LQYNHGHWHGPVAASQTAFWLAGFYVFGENRKQSARIQLATKINDGLLNG
jgi:hypothetical protein